MAAQLRTLVLDGGVSTLLESRVGRLHPTLWSAALLADPTGREALAAAHRDFAATGSVASRK
jgi:S-methylmethionine-dependent homocysteine/selenocysteine methylase